MAQAIMDPEKVRRFADELQRFNTDLETRMSLPAPIYLAQRKEI